MTQEVGLRLDEATGAAVNALATISLWKVSSQLMPVGQSELGWVTVGVRQVIDARYCNEETPDLPISHRQPV